MPNCRGGNGNGSDVEVVKVAPKKTEYEIETMRSKGAEQKVIVHRTINYCYYCSLQTAPKN